MIVIRPAQDQFGPHEAIVEPIPDPDGHIVGPEGTAEVFGDELQDLRCQRWALHLAQDGLRRPVGPAVDAEYGREHQRADNHGRQHLAQRES